MKWQAIGAVVCLLLRTGAAAQRAPGLSSCVEPQVQLGIHVYRLLDRENQEVGTVSQAWTWSDEGGLAALRLHVIATGQNGSFRIESTFEFDQRGLWPLRAVVRTDTAQPSMELRRIANRLVGHVIGRDGQRESVDFEAHEPVIMPGSAVALVPLIDWDRCEVVVASALRPPDELEAVVFRRSETSVSVAGKPVPAYAVAVQEPGSTTVVYVSRVRPRVELHRENSLAKLAWLR